MNPGYEGEQILYPGDEGFWDPDYYLPRFEMVQPKRGGRPIPFVLNPVQRILSAAVVRCYLERKWLAHVKPRKEGSSTLFTTIATQHTMHRFGCHALIVAQKDDVAAELARTAIRAYKTCSHPARPTQNSKLKRTLEFADRDSYLNIASVGEDDPGRGYTGIHCLVATEICKWGAVAGPDAWTSLLSTIPDPDPTSEEDAFVVAESTPRNHGDELQKLYERAREPDSPWLTCFQPWTIVPEYAAEPPLGWEAAERVADYAQTHYLSIEQAFWMQAVGLPKCNQSLERFQAEYPINEIECWALRGEKIFDLDRLRAMLKALDGGTNVTETVANEIRYEEREFGHTYVVACDPAGSFAKADMFAIVVLDLTTCSVVYEFLGHMNAYDCAVKLADLGYEYNRAEVYVEANGVGEAVLVPLVEMYPRTFWRTEDESNSRRTSAKDKKPGWSSNKKTKVEAVGITQELILDGSLTIPSHRILVQLSDYRGQWDKLKRERDANKGHFDLVAALCIACWAYVRKGSHRKIVRRPETPEQRVDRLWKKLQREAAGGAGGKPNSVYGDHR